MSSPRVVQSESWQSAIWRIRELSSNLLVTENIGVAYATSDDLTTAYLINFPACRNYALEFNLRRFYNALHRSSFTNRNDFLKQFNVNSAAINNILQARTIKCMGHLLMGRANNTVAHPTKILRETWTHPAAPPCCELKIEVH